MSAECNDGPTGRAGLVRARPGLSAHPLLLLPALLSLTACAHCHRGVDLQLPEDGYGPLPESRDALIAEADKMVIKGPAGPSPARSYRAAEKCRLNFSCERDAEWRMARALYLMTLTSSSTADAGRLAKRCLKVERSQDPPAEADYYVALCMGARAIARKTDALSLIPKMVDRGEAALKKDPTLFYGGPHRLLGGVYLRAPAWPLSVGDLDEALVHLEKAVELGPDWPENHLMLAEAYIEDERVDEAQAVLEKARRLLENPEWAGWRRIWMRDLDVIEKRLSP